MDELNSSFGRLSTDAREWKPSGVGAGPSVTDLSASKVKEFVPGQAWSGVSTGGAGAAPTSKASGDPSQAQAQPSIAVGATYDEDPSYDQEEHGSTFPAGLGPPPPYSPPFRALHSLGVSDELWRHYREQSLLSCRQMDPSDPRHKAVPLPYCNAFCLDPPHSQNTRSSFGYPANTFQVTNREDGFLYCLRRFDSCRTVSPKIAAAVTERWTNPNLATVTEHPSIARFYQCFVAQRAVFFVHQFVPGAQTLRERLLLLQQQQASSSHITNPPLLLPEPVVWSFVVQLVSAVSAIHAVGLAVRCLDVAHVLVTEPPSTGRLRVRLSGVGIVDALEFETRRHIHEWQQLDLQALGKLLLTVTSGGRNLTGHGVANNQWADCEAILAQNYSRELHTLAMTLLRSGVNLHRSPNLPAPPPNPSIRDVSRAIWSHIQQEQAETYADLDRTSTALAAEYDSSRALRLLLKLGFVNERPEFGPNRRWSQSGDCYVLSLFRDFGTLRSPDTIQHLLELYDTIPVSHNKVRPYVHQSFIRRMVLGTL